MGRHRRGVRLLDEPSRHHLPAAARHPGRLGHRGQRAGHGVRQHGRGLRHRRLLHPQPVDRGERVLRRIPGERAGRGRGRRHPHAAADVRRGRQARRDLAGNRDAGRLRRTGKRPRRAGKALPRHAGHGVHDPAEAAVYVADTQRQAHRRGVAAHCRRHGERGADRSEGSGAAGQSVGARPVAAPDARSRGAAHPAGERLAGEPGGRVGRRGVQRRRGGEPGRQGRGGDPGPRRNQPRGHPRHECRARHPDDARRHDQSRRGGGARHGPGVRCRRRRRRGGLQRADAGDRRAGGSGGGNHHAGWRHRRGVPGPGGHDRAGDVRRFQHADAMGGREPPAGHSRQRGNPARCRDRAEIRRRGHWPLPHRAHVLRPRADRRGAPDDHGAATRPAGAPRWPGCCRSSATISTSCSASWPGCR